MTESINAVGAIKFESKDFDRKQRVIDITGHRILWSLMTKQPSKGELYKKDITTDNFYIANFIEPKQRILDDYFPVQTYQIDSGDTHVFPLKCILNPVELKEHLKLLFFNDSSHREHWGKLYSQLTDNYIHEIRKCNWNPRFMTMAKQLDLLIAKGGHSEGYLRQLRGTLADTDISVKLDYPIYIPFFVIPCAHGKSFGVIDTETLQKYPHADANRIVLHHGALCVMEVNFKPDKHTSYYIDDEVFDEPFRAMGLRVAQNIISEYLNFLSPGRMRTFGPTDVKEFYDTYMKSVKGSAGSESKNPAKETTVSFVVDAITPITGWIDIDRQNTIKRATTFQIPISLDLEQLDYSSTQFIEHLSEIESTMMYDDIIVDIKRPMEVAIYFHASKGCDSLFKILPYLADDLLADKNIAVKQTRHILDQKNIQEKDNCSLLYVFRIDDDTIPINVINNINEIKRSNRFYSVICVAIKFVPRDNDKILSADSDILQLLFQPTIGHHFTGKYVIEQNRHVMEKIVKIIK